MTNEERDLITRFIQRVGGAPAGGFSGSVPTTGAQPLPPVDREADALLADLFTRIPEARYRITQMAFVQEHALAEAQNQISQLRWQIQNLQQQQAPAQPSSPWGQPQQAQQPPQRGFFDNLFGGRSAPPQQPQYAPQPQYNPPPPQYAPGYQPGMFQQQGPGFLGSALRTAAGVAGGVVAGEALMNLFSGGHQGYGGGFGGGGFGGGGFGGPQIVENVTINEAPQGSPWGTPAAAPGFDPYDAGGAPKDSGWTREVADNSDWQDSSGGWTDTSDTDDTV